MYNDQIIYVSFDRFPAPKGAATHISYFTQALGREYSSVDLVTLMGHDDFDSPKAPGVTHHPLPAIGENMITRAIAFRAELGLWWKERKANVIHVRSIYEGYPIAIRKKQLCEYFIYEANGFPSVELKFHHPNVDNDDVLRKKILHQEEICLKEADLIITVSEVNAEYIRARGVESEKILVIPNGVDLNVFKWKESQFDDKTPLRLIYSGTMTRWQGVHHAIEAAQLYAKDYPVKLILAGPCKYKERKAIFRTIDRLKMNDHVEIVGAIKQKELVKLLHDSDVALAPLPANDRNLEQGCCPLKVLEAMAAGTPLIASDIPVVRELAEKQKEAILVRPSSAKAIKDGLLELKNNQKLFSKLSVAARGRIEKDFQWSRATSQLLEAYERFMPPKRKRDLKASPNS
jgi:glycosyltransferase involved in cell wall biosynthesis